MKNAVKKFFKELGKDLFTFAQGVCASLIGFANIVAILFGYNCLVNIRVSSSWGAIGYFLGALAMVIIFGFVSYVVGLLVKKIFQK